LFYIRTYNQKGYKLSEERTGNVEKDSLFLKDLKNEQKIVVFQQNIEKVLQSNYEIELLYTFEEYKLYRILMPKSQKAIPK
jgi:hypothetical protein